MHKLPVATSPNCTSHLILRFRGCSASVPAPITAFGESASVGIMPWNPITGLAVQMTTHLDSECILSRIAGASPNPITITSTSGGL